MEKIKALFTKEFLTGYSYFDRVFMLVMLITQIVVFYIHPDSFLGIIAGISGVISVTLCAKGKISFYLIGFIQTFSYLFLAWENYFYGEVIENIFYIVTMIWGIWIWKNNQIIDKDGAVYVEVLKFTPKQWILSIIGTIICTLGMGYWLTSIGSHQAYTDAATDILSIFGQILMIKRYREQWLWWLVIDILCFKMWLIAGNWSMVAMYIAWIIDCIYGWYNWNKLEKEPSSATLVKLEKNLK